MRVGLSVSAYWPLPPGTCPKFRNLIQHAPESQGFWDKLDEFFPYEDGAFSESAAAFIGDFNDHAEFRTYVSGAPDGMGAWKAISIDQSLRASTDKIEKVLAYNSDFGRTFDEIADEFSSLPEGERGFWIDHLEFRTSGSHLNKSGNREDLFSTYATDEVVPDRYTSDNRYDELSFDPDHGDKTKGSRQEAMVGLEAESQGLIPSPISRDPNGAEFIDGNGGYWDVKTPPGPFFEQQFGNLVLRIEDELTLTPHNVILDCSYINDIQLAQLRGWLVDNLSESDLSKVIEVNANLNQWRG